MPIGAWSRRASAASVSGPGSASRRCRVRLRNSAAAFSVKVIAAIPVIGTPERTRLTMRATSELVLPAPAPASTNRVVSRSVRIRSRAASSGGSDRVSAAPWGPSRVRLVDVEPRSESRVVVFALPFGPAFGGAEPVGLAVVTADVEPPAGSLRAVGKKPVSMPSTTSAIASLTSRRPRGSSGTRVGRSHPCGAGRTRRAPACRRRRIVHGRPLRSSAAGRASRRRWGRRRSCP